MPYTITYDEENATIDVNNIQSEDEFDLVIDHLMNTTYWCIGWEYDEDNDIAYISVDSRYLDDEASRAKAIEQLKIVMSRK